MRYTEKDLADAVSQINHTMGRPVIECTHRYNYWGVDKVNEDGNPTGSPLITGTKRECYLYMRAVLYGMWCYKEGQM